MPLATYEHFASRDPLTALVLEQMLAGVSTRRLARTREPVGEEVTAVERSASKSANSRAFIARTQESLDALMARRLDDVRLAVLMLDGIDLKGRTNVVALGITTDGGKLPLGLWEGSTENAAVATALLADLVDRGLDVEQGVLVVLDGGKALRKAVNQVLGAHTPVQRCTRHKERNVLDLLPDRDRDRVKARLRDAWATADHATAQGQLESLARELEHPHPGAAASLREGLVETLTVQRLGVSGKFEEDARLDQPDREHDRVHPPLEPQRQALAERQHGAALDRRRDARSRATVPARDRRRRSREARDRRRGRHHALPSG